jgi:hypothetical protein
LVGKLELCFSHVGFRLVEREIIKMGSYEKI